MSFSAYMEGSPVFMAQVEALASDDILCASVVTLGEVTYGIARLPQTGRRAWLEQEFEIAVESVEIVDVTQYVARRFGALKRELEERGTPIGDDNDLWIAATALVHNMTLVSSQKSFRQVKGLKVKDWLK
jgi:tRNA(fMet)-specific endonuclease VapC